MSTAHPGRYRSVDAMRGLTVATMLVVNNPGDWNHVYAVLPHSPWNGCSVADLVFPFFLFLVGVSITLHQASTATKNVAYLAFHGHVTARSIKLMATGLMLNGIMMWTFHAPHFFWMGTLQRIGICYLVASWIAWHTGPRTQWLIFLSLLIGYALLLHGGGSYAPFANLSDRVDNALLGTHALITNPQTGLHRDPDGILSTLGAVSTTILGIRAGDWLRHGNHRLLFLIGLLALLAGYGWSLHGVPFNKKMWTGPFVLWTGGWALLALGIFHIGVDRHPRHAMGHSLGIHALAAYVASLLLFFVLYRLDWYHAIYRDLFASWIAPLWGPKAASLCYALAFAGAIWMAFSAPPRLARIKHGFLHLPSGPFSKSMAQNSLYENQSNLLPR